MSVATVTKQRQHHYYCDQAGNEQVFAKAPATSPQAYGIVYDRLLGKGLLRKSHQFGS